MDLFRKRLISGVTGGRKATSLLRAGLFAAAIALPACAFLALPSITAAAKDAAVKGADAPIVGAPKRLRLLTTQQYINTIQYFFGPDIKIDVKFSPLARTDGLLVSGSSIAGVSDAQIEIYQKVANIVSTQVLAPERRETLIPCKPKNDKAADNACAAKFLGDVSGYLYRAPLSKDRLANLVSDAGKAADQLKDFYAGLQLTLEGVLMSPNVLFVAETEEADPKRPGQMRLDGYSLASRLSLFLWNAAPDATLRQAAAKGQLDNEKTRAKIVDMMLASPRLEAGVRSFFDDMFGFDDFETLAKDAMAYPYFLGEAAGDAREQTLRTVVDQLLTKNRDYRDLYTTRETFISPALAIIYGVPTTPGWRAIEFPPESHRTGILTQVSFLALHSHPGRSSATLRGKALQATAINRVGAQLMGIRSNEAGSQAFFLSAMIGGLSGLLIAPITTIFYDTGFLIGLKGFVAAIVGGLFSYPLAAMGALLVGLIEAFASFWASAFKEVLVFTLILPVLLWRSLRAHHSEEDEE